MATVLWQPRYLKRGEKNHPAKPGGLSKRFYLRRLAHPIGALVYIKKGRCMLRGAQLVTKSPLILHIGVTIPLVEKWQFSRPSHKVIENWSKELDPLFLKIPSF
eukprot:sb/3478066/